MNRNLISIVILSFCIFMLYVNYNLVKNYYNLSYYNIEIQIPQKELVIKEAENSLNVNVILKNKTRKNISSANNIYLSYHIFDINMNEVRFENSRTLINNIGPYGTSPPIILNIERPEEEGEYILQIDLVEENITWFKNMGNNVFEIKLTVM